MPTLRQNVPGAVGSPWNQLVSQRNVRITNMQFKDFNDAVFCIISDKKPCTLPSLEHGKFQGTATDVADDNRFHVAFQDYDTVQSGDLLTVFCDTGYLINVRLIHSGDFDRFIENFFFHRVTQTSVALMVSGVYPTFPSAFRRRVYFLMFPVPTTWWGN